MPNTIAHFAVNGLVSRAIIKNADLKWIYLGCIIPDIPWILQRIIRSLPFSVDLYDLRAYCIAQSSFLMCCMLCLAFCALAKQSNRVFIILILGCLLHLLVDAFQIKWANGVQLFAPVDWQLFRMDFFWPESLGTYLLTAAGLIYFIVNLKKVIQPNCDEFIISAKNLAISMLFGLLWLAIPFAFISSVYQADNHYIATLKEVDKRAGKSVEIDRNQVIHALDAFKLKTSYGEMITLNNLQVENGALVSLKGKFSDNHTIKVEQHHLHSQFRNYASMFGLACVLLIWLVFITRCSIESRQKR